MNTCRSFLVVAAVFLVNTSYSLAASMISLTETPDAIDGIDNETGIEFHSSLISSDHVLIDLYIGAKHVHADIDYGNQKLQIISASRSDNSSIILTEPDITAFQELLVTLPPEVNGNNLHGDALTTVVNLIASAPVDNAIIINSSGKTYTSICAEIGEAGTAKVGRYSDAVTVGPVCYTAPALGRCGAGGGPDPLIGWQQKFTQQCLNHDDCCDLYDKGPPVCGHKCLPEFTAAAPGFFFAPDCGTTAGDWHDVVNRKYVLTGGNSKGPNRPFTGTVFLPECGTSNVTGVRAGTAFSFTFSSPNRQCPAVTVTGSYGDCNVAQGTETDEYSSGTYSGPWSWVRTNTVGR